MKKLLLKEYYVNQTTYALTFIIFVFAAGFVANNQIPAFLSTLFTVIFLFSTSNVDDQNKSHILINSLPVNRGLVISSKYLIGLLIGVLLLILTIALNAFIPIYTPLPAVSIALTAVAIIMTIALYYPTYIIFGSRFMSYALTAVFIAFVAMSPIILHTNAFDTVTIFLQQQSTVILITGMTVASIVILILSWMISVRVYAAKQF